MLINDELDEFCEIELKNCDDNIIITEFLELAVT